jgi:hypothetical protein
MAHSKPGGHQVMGNLPRLAETTNLAETANLGHNRSNKQKNCHYYQ